MTDARWVGQTEAQRILGYRDRASVTRLAKNNHVTVKPNPKNPRWNLYNLKELIAAFKKRGAQRVGPTDIENSLIAENVQLRQQLRDALRVREIKPHEFKENQVRFGVITDTQYGSLYTNFTCIEAAYSTFKKEGISNVYHIGDMCDGEKMYRGQTYELMAHGADAQVGEVQENYPMIEGITTYFILGNHDLSFWKTAGTDIGEKISNRRSDLICLGKEQVDVPVKTPGGYIKLRLSHPGKGTAYALSYHPQKYIEQLSGGEKPHILLFGHWHKAELIPMYRNVCAIQCGCAQSQTPFMMRNNIAAHVGFWIVEATVNEPKLISRFRAEFFAIFEETL